MIIISSEKKRRKKSVLKYTKSVCAKTKRPNKNGNRYWFLWGRLCRLDNCHVVQSTVCCEHDSLLAILSFDISKCHHFPILTCFLVTFFPVLVCVTQFCLLEVHASFFSFSDNGWAVEVGYSLTVRALSLNSYTNQLFFQFIDTHISHFGQWLYLHWMYGYKVQGLLMGRNEGKWGF